MAATRLIPMHSSGSKSVGKSLKDRTDYAKNDDKTENGEYVTSYECNAASVDSEFNAARNEYLKNHREKKNDVIAYQIRQSFKPGEVSPDEANAIGRELAMRFTKGDYAFIVATHVDKAHIHNHVIFNAVNITGEKKFQNFFWSSIALRRVSDLICLEHGLSVIKPKPFGEREKRTTYPKRPSYRESIKAAIDEALSKNPETMDDFYRLLLQEEFEIKNAKYKSIKGEGQKRFIRFKSLGSGYTEEDIAKRISGEFLDSAEKISDRKENFSYQKDRDHFDMLIDTQDVITKGKGAGYEYWTNKYNVKQISKVLLFLSEHDCRDYKTLCQRAEESSSRFGELSALIKDAESRMGEIAVLKKHIINYAKTKDVYVAYRKSGYSKKFFEEHRADITIHKAAKEAFKELNVEKLPRIKELNEEYSELIQKKKSFYEEYRQVKKEMRDYQVAKYDIEKLLHMDPEKDAQKQKSKNGRDESSL